MTETQTESPHIVGLRFQKLGKTYHFDASDFRTLEVGDFAVVDTRRGKQLGQVVQVLEDVPDPGTEHLDQLADLLRP